MFLRKTRATNFDRSSADPDQLHKAQQAWVSLVTSCKGVAFDIVNAEESASEARAKLVQHYQASGLQESRRVAIDFYMMKMELGEHPRKFLLRVDQMEKDLVRQNSAEVHLLNEFHRKTFRPKCFYETHSADACTASFRMFTRITYPLCINYQYLPLVARITVPSNYGSYYRGLETPGFLNGTVYSYHGYFLFSSEFMPVFVTFYGSLMVHGYGYVPRF